MTPLLMFSMLVFSTAVTQGGPRVPYRRAQILDPLVRVIVTNAQLRKWTGELGPPFNEPLWLSPKRILAHSNCGDGYLCGIYRMNLTTGRLRRDRRLDK